MNRKLTRPLLSLALAGTLGAAVVLDADAAPAPPHAGDVLQLDQTPHRWVVDGQGIAHFAGDPRALADRQIDRGTSRAFTAAELAALARGGPWLSTALVKIGDSVYVPSFPAPGAPPMLYRIQSPADLTLLGVTAANYDELVLDRATWAQRYGYDPAQLPADEFRFYPAPDFNGSLDSSDPPPAAVRPAVPASPEAAGINGVSPSDGQSGAPLPASLD